METNSGIGSKGFIQDMGDLRRTCYCGDVSLADVSKEVVLMGWVNRQRDLGDLIFIDLRDRKGLVQVVLDPRRSKTAFETGKKVRSEFVILVRGHVTKRAPGRENPNISTGQVEVMAEELRVLNVAKTPPFVIQDQAEPDDSLRLRYRYLDLRRLPMQKNLELRHKVTKVVRDYLSENGFLEIETPMMTRSTPEGARDYLVPSRLEPGKFYALAQSPQLFKQILMISGLDRYFQLVRCFRDEDLRADRQPEFTQIDLEMSFVDEEMVYALVEGLFQRIFKEALGIHIVTPFKRLSYKEAIARYGVDKPDTRFGMDIVDITDIAKTIDFPVFQTVIGEKGAVRAILVPGKADMSRQEISRLEERAKELGARGLISLSLSGGQMKSPIKKYLSIEKAFEILRAMGGKEGQDLVLMVAGIPDASSAVLGRLRLELGSSLGLIPEGKWNFLWVTEFPLFKRNEETQEWEAAHHPFTSPVMEDIENLGAVTEDSKGQIRARSYDLVLNGVELGSGSIRIHRRDLQEKVFGLLGLSHEEAVKKFGFLLEAFEYGAPPHGGMAFGLDRIVMLMAGCQTIREVIAFPKTQRATCLLTEAPSEVKKEQLDELHLAIVGGKEKKNGETRGKDSGTSSGGGNSQKGV